MKYIIIIFSLVFTSCNKNPESPTIFAASTSITQTQLNNAVAPLVKDISGLKSQLSWVISQKKKDSLSYLTDKLSWKTQLSTAQSTATSAMSIANKQTLLKGTVGQVTILGKDTLVISLPDIQNRLLNIESKLPK